jgi:Rad3-related DNA helicase
VTQAAKRTPADVLREARRRDSDRKRELVFRTVDAMKRDGTPITFAAIAREAMVSQWLVYADGVREYIEAARVAQGARAVQSKRADESASQASLRTDLELAKQDNRRLRTEVERLRKALRQRLGEQLDRESVESLRRRVDELVASHDRYRTENVRLEAELLSSRQRLDDAEREVAATRTSLRRMIRAQAIDPGPIVRGD